MAQNPKQPCVYILASARRGTFYMVVTSNLCKRIYEHKNDITGGFSEKYNVKKLVYYELHGNMDEAILREKKIKKWPREYKYNMIEEMNPHWEDLFQSLCNDNQTQ